MWLLVQNQPLLFMIRYRLIRHALLTLSLITRWPMASAEQISFNNMCEGIHFPWAANWSTAIFTNAYHRCAKAGRAFASSRDV
jgi:hypothetical protein